MLDIRRVKSTEWPSVREDSEAYQTKNAGILMHGESEQCEINLIVKRETAQIYS